jgi:hypothetical protein
MSVLGSQAPVLRDGFGDLIHINISDITQRFNVINMTSDKLGTR